MARAQSMNAQIGECGVCGNWGQGDALPSGDTRSDGTTPHDNFVCWRCQREARELREINCGLGQYVSKL